MTAPVVGETCGNVATWAAEGYDLDRIIHEGYNQHMSVFMPKNVYFPERWMDKLAEFDKKLGYRFVLRQMCLPLEIKGGEKFSPEVYIDNVGVAPIYRPYKLAMRLTQGKRTEILLFKEDIRKWLPANSWFKEELVFPEGFERGGVKVALGIVDDTKTPRVWFAIKGKTDDGWHPLMSIDVV
jgi:hypothetical protein